MLINGGNKLVMRTRDSPEQDECVDDAITKYQALFYLQYICTSVIRF